MYRYPVKSLGGEVLHSLPTEERGFTDDRRWMLVDAQGKFLSQRTYHHLASFTARVAGNDNLVITDGEQRTFSISRARPHAGESLAVTVWDDTLNAQLVEAPGLASFLGIFDARLVYMAPSSLRPVDPRYAKNGETVSFADGFPYLVTTVGSLEELERRVGYPLGMQRFRPNIVIEGSVAFAEDGWTRLRIGGATLQLPKPCARCIMVTVEPGTGRKDLAVLSTLASFRRFGNKTMFGMNAVLDSPGEVIAVGDPVTVLAS